MSDISATINEFNKDDLQLIDMKIQDVDNKVEISSENDSLNKPDFETKVQLTHNKWQQV